MIPKSPENTSILLATHHFFFLPFKYQIEGKAGFEIIDGKLLIQIEFCTLYLKPRYDENWYKGMILPQLHCEGITEAQNYEEIPDTKNINAFPNSGEIYLINKKKNIATIQEIYTENTTTINRNF